MCEEQQQAGVEERLHLLLTRHQVQVEVNRQLHISAGLPQRTVRTGWASKTFWTLWAGEKSLASTGNRICEICETYCNIPALDGGRGVCNQDSVFGIVSRMQAGYFGYYQQKIFCFFSKVCRPNLEPIQPRIRSVLLRQSNLGQRLKKLFHLLSRLRICTSAPLPPYAFMVCTMISLPLHFYRLVIYFSVSPMICESL